MNSSKLRRGVGGMDYSPNQKKVYIKTLDSAPTFEEDESLPRLPVPTLQETLDKYLLSVQPFLTPQELENTTQLCQSFQVSQQGQDLQTLLIERSKTRRNWLEEWWLRKGYLQFREPLIPFMNIAGPFAANNPNGAWPVHVETPMKNVSMFVFQLMQFWKCLRAGQLKADIAKKTGSRQSMDQFRYLFNTTRIPRQDEDVLRHYWKPENEENVAHIVPKHAIVLRNGHIFLFHPLKKNGANSGEELKCPQEIEMDLRKIKAHADAKKPGPGVAALTCDRRDRWAQNRLHLLKSNAGSLDLIESAMFVIVLDEDRPSSDSECCWSLMAGNPSNRWADKSLQVIVFDNGRGGVNSDHSPLDAMVNVVMSHFIDLGVNDHLKCNPTADSEKLLTYSEAEGVVTELPWQLDDTIIQCIQTAKAMSLQLGNSLLLKRKAFTDFGKKALTKEVQVNPDTFLQMAIQLAFQRLHHKAAPTYETASTRQFYHGRTETLRSCTPELTEFCRSMNSSSFTPKAELVTLLQKALSAHDRLMSEARQGFGCDRHLFGLQCLAEEQSMIPMPALFTDKAYVLSGGNGNFVLSTSTCGYTGMSGGTSPMVQDGYGCFYNFETDCIWLWITAFRHSYETSVEKFTRSLEESLRDIFALLKLQNQPSSNL